MSNGQVRSPIQFVGASICRCKLYILQYLLHFLRIDIINIASIQKLILQTTVKYAEDGRATQTYNICSRFIEACCE